MYSRNYVLFLYFNKHYYYNEKQVHPESVPENTDEPEKLHAQEIFHIYELQKGQDTKCARVGGAARWQKIIQGRIKLVIEFHKTPP